MKAVPFHAFCLLTMLAYAPVAGAAELQVLTAGAFEPVVLALAPAFEKQSGHALRVEKGNAGMLRKRVENGDAFDVVVITAPVVAQLAQDGKWIAQSQTPVATVGVGVGVKEGAPKPDISTVDGLKRALLAAKGVAYTDPAGGGTSGKYIGTLLERLGIADQVRPKSKLTKGGHAGEFVASGEADIVLQQAREIIPVRGVTLIGPLPPEIQLTTTYSAAISPHSRQPEAAQALLKFLSGPEAAAMLRAKGMEQAQPKP
jgi:molybdate transport system substrate-binding protein